MPGYPSVWRMPSKKTAKGLKRLLDAANNGDSKIAFNRDHDGSPLVHTEECLGKWFSEGANHDKCNCKCHAIPVCKECFREMVPLEWRLRNGICPMCKLKEELGK